MGDSSAGREAPRTSPSSPVTAVAVAPEPAAAPPVDATRKDAPAYYGALHLQGCKTAVPTNTRHARCGVSSWLATLMASVLRWKAHSCSWTSTLSHLWSASTNTRRHLRSVANPCVLTVRRRTMQAH